MSAEREIGILIAGYYGMGNLGDEIILSELVRRIRLHCARAQVRCRIEVLSGEPEETSRRLEVFAVGRKSVFGILRALLSVDILIVGGGGIFQDATSSFSLYYYLALVLAAKTLGRKVSLCAVGIDRLKKFNAFLTRLVLSRADTVSVRDDESKEFAETFRRDAVPRVADLAAALPADFIRGKKTGSPPAKKIILVPRRFKRSDINFWARLADAFAGRFGAAIKIIPFHRAHDFKYATRIAGNMTAAAEVVVWDDVYATAAEFADASAVISARLHGIILAAVAGVPVCGVSADRKSDLFLRDISQKNIYGGGVSEETAAAVVADMLRWSDDFRRSIEASRGRFARLVEPAVPFALSPLAEFSGGITGEAG